MIPAAPPPSPASPKYAVLGRDASLPGTPRLAQTAKGCAQSGLQRSVVVQPYASSYRTAPCRANAQAPSTPMRERASVAAVLVPKLDMRKVQLEQK